MKFHALVTSIDLDTRKVGLHVVAAEEGITDERIKRLVEFLGSACEVELEVPSKKPGPGAYREPGAAAAEWIRANGIDVGLDPKDIAAVEDSLAKFLVSWSATPLVSTSEVQK